jgi:hypothetical protein
MSECRSQGAVVGHLNFEGSRVSGNDRGEPWSLNFCALRDLCSVARSNAINRCSYPWSVQETSYDTVSAADANLRNLGKGRYRVVERIAKLGDALVYYSISMLSSCVHYVNV